MLLKTMMPSVRRLGRYLKTVRLKGDQRLDNWRNSREGHTFEYLAIHDGRTFNACVGVGSVAISLQSEGADAVPLAPPSVEGDRHIWVVDLLDLGLPTGTYRVCAVDVIGVEHATFPPPKAPVVAGEPMTDGKVDDLASPAATVLLVDRAVRIQITDGDGRPRVQSLNYQGPEAFRIEMSSAGADRRVVATARETGDTVDIGGVSDGVGKIHVTKLYSQDSGHELRWDLALQDESGHSRAIQGPAVDYNRPDQATSFGDISVIRSGKQDRWKPYITRDGRLAVRVTAEQRQGSI